MGALGGLKFGRVGRGFPQSEPWHRVPADDFTANWVNDSDYEPLSYYKDVFGYVHLRGNVRLADKIDPNLTDQIVTYLPEGYRPEAGVAVPFEAWHDLGVIGKGVAMYFGEVGGDGYLRLRGRVASPSGNATNVRTTLADATFRAAP